MLIASGEVRCLVAPSAMAIEFLSGGQVTILMTAVIVVEPQLQSPKSTDRVTER